mmetsp:Transcript_90198/g.259939  ORF Transcript_90198/g.259939 Transcript_90198/m.259939 type:complete len:304 (-) Transcript_90198:1142-2053(-)
MAAISTLISIKPRRRTAALVFAARPSPSQKPAASATTFFKPPKSSTPNTSVVERTLKVGQSNSRVSNTLSSAWEQPNVASAKLPVATSFATFAPFKTAHSGMLSASAMTWLPVRRVLPSSLTTMCPLINETAIVPGATCGAICFNKPPKNWCGSTKTKMLALFTASTASGSATTLCGSGKPGKYFTFSCSVLMISVNLRPSICSSCTHIVTVFWKSTFRWTFWPTILAIAVPQFPEPKTVTFMALARRTRGIAIWMRLAGGSCLVRMRCIFEMNGNSISACSLRTKTATSLTMLMPVGSFVSP